METTNPDEKRLAEAKKRVAELKEFYNHLIVYIGVNVMLLVINLVTSPGAWWFYWVTIFWGIGVMWHAIGTFGTGQLMDKRWEEKKIKEYLEKDKK